MRQLRPYVAVVLVLWGLPVALVALLHATLPTTNPDGRCTGIGWGCSLPPADAAVFLSYLAAAVLVLAGVIVMLVVGAVRWRRASRPSR